jgi:hypothetical protein
MEKESFAQFLENLVVRYVNEDSTPVKKNKKEIKKKTPVIEKTETPIADKIEKEFGDVNEVLAAALNASPESPQEKEKQAITSRLKV